MVFRPDETAEKETFCISLFSFASHMKSLVLTACHIRTVLTMMAKGTQYGSFFTPSV